MLPPPHLLFLLISPWLVAGHSFLLPEALPQNEIWGFASEWSLPLTLNTQDNKQTYCLGPKFIRRLSIFFWLAVLAPFPIWRISSAALFVWKSCMRIPFNTSARKSMEQLQQYQPSKGKHWEHRGAFQQPLQYHCCAEDCRPQSRHAHGLCNLRAFAQATIALKKWWCLV